MLSNTRLEAIQESKARHQLIHCLPDNPLLYNKTVQIQRIVFFISEGRFFYFMGEFAFQQFETPKFSEQLFQLSPKYLILRGRCLFIRFGDEQSSVHQVISTEVVMKPFVLEAKIRPSQWLQLGDKHRAVSIENI